MLTKIGLRQLQAANVPDGDSRRWSEHLSAWIKQSGAIDRLSDYPQRPPSMRKTCQLHTNITLMSSLRPFSVAARTNLLQAC